MRDWRPEIVHLVQIKQQIDDVDVKGLWEYHLPKVAATEDQIAAAEAHLGVRLDAQYREFLGYANGWPSFLQDIDLFGTEDLTGGPRFDLASRLLHAVEPLVLEQAGLARDAVVPIAASTTDRDIYLMPTIDGIQAPPVVWISGEEVDRFSSFEDYVLAMIEYNRRELAMLRGDEQPG